MTADLQISALNKRFISPRGDVVALRDVSFSARRGEFVTIVGPSGCGKSTLLRLVAGLITSDSGEISFRGWPNAPRRAMVFQDAALFPWMSVIDNVAIGLETGGVTLAERRQRAGDILQRMGLAAFAAHYPHELSGGMNHRAAIARAFVTEPDILLMDEPLRALDAQMRLVIQEELLTLWESKRPVVLYVTHDIEEALLLADRVLVMSGQPGLIREEIRVPFGRPRDLIRRNQTGLEELKWHIWKMLERDVHRQLQTSAAKQV